MKLTEADRGGRGGRFGDFLVSSQESSLLSAIKRTFSRSGPGRQPADPQRRCVRGALVTCGENTSPCCARSVCRCRAPRHRSRAAKCDGRPRNGPERRQHPPLPLFFGIHVISIMPLSFQESLLLAPRKWTLLAQRHRTPTGASTAAPCPKSTGGLWRRATPAVADEPFVMRLASPAGRPPKVFKG